VSGAPDPKSRTLARGERRRFRRKASMAEWTRIVKAKIGPCRVCCDPGSNGSQWGKIQMHHLVSRARGGDDVADNIVPLCLGCHDQVTREAPIAREILAANLTDAEYAYVVGKLGEDGPARLFGVGAR
jgi:5-methylcytosine-specific restriction endonuclease McrA